MKFVKKNMEASEKVELGRFSLDCQAPPRLDLRLQLDQRCLERQRILQGSPKGEHSNLSSLGSFSEISHENVDCDSFLCPSGTEGCK